MEESSTLSCSILKTQFPTFNFPSEQVDLTPPNSPDSGTFEIFETFDTFHLTRSSTSPIPQSQEQLRDSNKTTQNFGSFLYTFQLPPLDDVNLRTQEHKSQSIANLCNSLFLKMYSHNDEKKGRNRRRQLANQHSERVGQNTICKNEQNVCNVNR